MALHYLIPVLALLFIPLSGVKAANLNYNDNLLEFSLSAEHQDTQFNFSTSTYKTRFDTLGINWYEPFTQSFHAGIEIGNFDMTQATNTQVSAQFTKGQYAGLLLRFIPLESQYLDFHINVNYRYSQSTGTVLTQSSQFAWHESLVSAEALLHLSEITRFFVAADYHRISGEQRDSGTVNKISSFSEERNAGYQIGLDFRSDRHNIIRLSWLTGYREGARVNFLHRF